MRPKIRTLLPVAVLLVGAALAAVMVVARPKVERQEVAIPPPLVRVIEARLEDHTLVVRSQGTVEPQIASRLVAQVAGRIDWVSPSFAEGGRFRRGETLVRIEDRDFRLALAQAEAGLAQARRRVESEEAEAELARLEWAELGGGEPTTLTLREPQLAEARAALGAAEAGLEKATLDLERTRVLAPFDGRVRGKQVDLGQYVAPGSPLGEIFASAAAEIRLPVPKDDLAFLDLGSDGPPGSPDALTAPRVTLRADLGGARRSWEARIVRVGSEFDPRTRMLPLFARVDDPFARRPGAAHASLPMGLFVEAEITGRRVEQVVLLPRSAMRGGTEVLVVDGESRLRFRPVEILRIEGDRAVIRSGLDHGELVCVSNLDTVVEGMRVRTQSEPPPARLEEAAEAGR